MYIRTEVRLPAERTDLLYPRYIHDYVKKKDLAIALQKVKNFDKPDPSLEQYMTNANLAAEMLFDAYANGDIAGMKIIDLGCGTGMLSIGSWLLGAGAVKGFDISEKALSVAETNRNAFGADTEFVHCDVCDVDEGADTVVMNPPFGCQTRNADRAFLNKAMEISECIYSIHMANSVDFVKEYCSEKGRSVCSCKIYKYDIPHVFAFHKRAKQTVDVAVLNIR